MGTVLKILNPNHHPLNTIGFDMGYWDSKGYVDKDGSYVKYEPHLPDPVIRDGYFYEKIEGDYEKITPKNETSTDDKSGQKGVKDPVGYLTKYLTLKEKK